MSIHPKRTTNFSWHIVDTWPPGLVQFFANKLIANRKESGEQLSDSGEIIPGGVSFNPFAFRAFFYLGSVSPRVVSLNEVAQYAKRSCNTCYGKGKFSMTRSLTIVRDGKKVPYSQECMSTCSCADKRFRKDNPNILIDPRRGEWVILEGTRTHILTDLVTTYNSFDTAPSFEDFNTSWTDAGNLLLTDVEFDELILEMTPPASEPEINEDSDADAAPDAEVEQ